MMKLLKSWENSDLYISNIVTAFLQLSKEVRRYQGS